MAIYVGSRLRVRIPLERVGADGETTEIDPDTLASITLRVVRPDGTEVEGATLEVPDTEEEDPYWDAGPGVLDQPGPWKAKITGDGYKSDPIHWWVLPDR